MTFKHRLVTAGDQARGVSAKIGEFDDQTSKSGTRPSRLIRPDGQILKKLIDNGFGRASKTLAEGSEGGQREGMLHFEHFAKKRVLACEVIIQCSLGNGGRRRDFVHAHARETLATEQAVGRIQDGLTSGRRGSRHLFSRWENVYRLVYLQQYASRLECDGRDPQSEAG